MHSLPFLMPLLFTLNHSSEAMIHIFREKKTLLRFQNYCIFYLRRWLKPCDKCVQGWTASNEGLMILGIRQCVAVWGKMGGILWNLSAALSSRDARCSSVPPSPSMPRERSRYPQKVEKIWKKYLKQIQTAALSSPDAPHPHPTAWENGGKNWKIEVCLAKPETGREKIHTHLCKVYLLWLLITMLISGTCIAWIMGDQNFSKYYIDPRPTPPLNCTTTLGERSAAALRDDVWEGGRRRRKCFGYYHKH